MKAGNAVQKPDEKPEPGSLIPGRNGGLVRVGSKPGMNRGGTGRPRNELRDLLRGFAYQKFPKFRAKWDTLTDDQQMRALELALKYGLGVQTETLTPERVQEEQKAMIEAFAQALRAEVSDEVAQRVVGKFRELWGAR